MTKSNQSPKKQMSEGKAIAIAVLLFVAASVAVVYALSFVIDYFFPNLF